MGILTKYVELKQYNNTIKDIRNEIKELKKLLLKKPSDNSNAARNALSKCTEYKNRCEEREKNIDNIYEDIISKQSKLNIELEEIESHKININSINNLSKETTKSISLLEDKIEALNSLFEDKDDLDNRISELSTIHENGEDLSNKINAIYKNIKTKKDEIDSLSYEIFGYEEENEDGTQEIIEGLKDKLEKSYNTIVSNLQKLKISLTEIESNSNDKYNDFIEEKEEIYSGLVNEINELLPNALTAGLSHAFSEKRKSEIEEGKKLSTKFSRTIGFLVLISLIPFSISLYQLIHGLELKEVIQDMPRMVLSILPLYVPIVWLAYSSSKKINLSKRLVEEYTHKEVLSKTFEGLSKQIDTIDDEEISAELRVKLLYNILSVSAENPGKLISDYNKADHPLMDALDKSAKLDDAIESIGKIPGLSKIASILENKSNRIKKEQMKKVDDILDETKNK